VQRLVDLLGGTVGVKSTPGVDPASASGCRHACSRTGSDLLGAVKVLRYLGGGRLPRPCDEAPSEVEPGEHRRDEHPIFLREGGHQAGAPRRPAFDPLAPSADGSALVGRDNVVVVLTADHGVTSYPERTRAKTGGAAYRVLLDTMITAVNRDLDRVAGAGAPPRAWLDFDTGMLFLRDNGRLAALGVKTDSVLDALVARIVRVPGVARVIKPADLGRADTASDPVARRWIHQLPPDAGVVLTVTLQPGSVWDIPNLPIAMHGQPSDDDSHVPIIFWGRGVRRGAFAGRMNTVDIAPTLGVLLGVTPLSLVDGHARTDALGPRN